MFKTIGDNQTASNIFEWLKKNRKDVLCKVFPVVGDISLPELGISQEDQNMLVEKISVVFHVAATVKFDEPLKISVGMNLTGTKRLLELCARMTKLESVVHVSTAYCNCDRAEADEILYPAPADPENVIKMVEILNDDMLNILTPKLVSTKRPNTYTFTKALAEHVVAEQGGRLPVAIFRPSIVSGAWKEPLPGWVDNLNGPTGILAGAGKGVLRSMICYGDCIADLIPVDLAINCLIAVAWQTAVKRPNNIIIYNCTSGATNPIKWGYLEDVGFQMILKYPPRDILWYPGGSFKTNHYLNTLHTLLAQMIPAYCIDFIAKMAGKKQFMVRVQEKILKNLKTIEFFTTREFRFKNDNVVNLFSNLKAEDKTVFNFDVTQIDWRTYLESYMLGTRSYVLKEDPSTIPEARINLRRMYWVQRICQLFLATTMFWAFINRSHLAKSALCCSLSYAVKSVSSLLRMVGNDL
ncbi:putative fatty acyl-CoA reductase CG5065 isoform X2 [Cimex lectularius]|uniref:Fatty acyl-CoA reductase n=1 Tax=Cimex lectularius TaxID=79782 RepID=A0A8I6RN94_CIMLE|nr:putative fatty acyl-CoA reductase CG5065 isoform X2 [Cimex lectularius]